MNKPFLINKLIENQIHNYYETESFFLKFEKLGFDSHKIENRFRYDFYPICEFYSIPPCWEFSSDGSKIPLNWEIIKSCSFLIGIIHQNDHVNHCLTFLFNLQKHFSDRGNFENHGPSIIANEFFKMFSLNSINNKIAFSSHPFIGNMYKNYIMTHIQLPQKSTKIIRKKKDIGTKKMNCNERI